MAMDCALGPDHKNYPMTAAKTDRALFEKLRYTFRQLDLLREALTHASHSISAKDKTYERLEFLGDRVLGLCIADALYAQNPTAQEGELAPRHTFLVRAETCAKVAADLDLGSHLILGTSELQSGGRSKAALLADVCEAIIGAIYIDGGYDAAQAFVARAWQPYLEQAPEQLRDAKTMLQEWAQSRVFGLPAYTLVKRDGPDHAPEFVMKVEVETLAAETGKGATKRHAEQEAAEKLMKREGVWPV